jgi:hypothetical protein
VKEMKDLKKENEPREGTSSRDSDHNNDSAKPQNRREQACQPSLAPKHTGSNRARVAILVGDQKWGL